MRRGRQIAFFLIYAINNGANISIKNNKDENHYFLDQEYLKSLREDFERDQTDEKNEEVFKLLKERFHLNKEAVIENISIYDENMASYNAEMTQQDLLKDSPKADHLGETPLFSNEVAYIEQTVEGVVSKKDVLGPIIDDALIGWKLERIGAIEKAILMLSTYELLYTPQVDAPIVINEALDLVKTYGDAGRSPKLINGVLDKIYQERV